MVNTLSLVRSKVLTAGGLLGSVTSKTPGTGCSDGTGKGVKVVGTTGGLMTGSVTVEPGAVVAGTDVALSVADDTEDVFDCDDEVAAAEEEGMTPEDALEDATELADVAERESEAEPEAEEVDNEAD